MARDVFVDTWGWYVLIDRCDPDHVRAASLVRHLIQGGVRLVSSDSVLDESCTLAKAFTDCTSFEIMCERGIEEAITRDDHFRIAGFQLLPDDSTP
jgi:predicted nucleic acid-binding protein